MRRGSFASIVTLAVAALLGGCGGENGTTGPDPSAATFDLTFTGDETFQGAHGGQTLHVGVRQQPSGGLVASDQAPVSASENPSFSFTFTDVLTEGVSYHLDYWIDSNFGGGTQGTCDPPDVDHQWRMVVPSVTGDVSVADTHRPTETQDVCGTDTDSPDPGY